MREFALKNSKRGPAQKAPSRGRITADQDCFGGLKGGSGGRKMRAVVSKVVEPSSRAVSFGVSAAKMSTRPLGWLASWLKLGVCRAFCLLSLDRTSVWHGS